MENCGITSKVGYGCLAMRESRYQPVIFLESKHGMCEMFVEREGR